MLGDYQNNNDVNYSEQVAPAQLPSQVDYDVIRRGLWESSDMMYKYALGMMTQKMNYLQQNLPSPEEPQLADMQPLPAVTHLEKRTAKYEIDQAALEQIVTEVSAIFKEYKDIYNSSVTINGTEVDIYRLTTEGVQLKQPGGFVSVTVNAEIRGDNGSPLGDSFSLSLQNPGELPSLEQLKEKNKSFRRRNVTLESCPFSNGTL